MALPCALHRQWRAFTSSGGSVSRWLLGEVDGYFKRDHSPDDLAAHWQAIMAETPFTPRFSSGASVRHTFAIFDANRDS